MKLEHMQTENTQPGKRAGSVERRATGPVVQNAQKEAGDRVNVSNAARSMAAASRRATAEQDVGPADPSRIAALKDAVRSGHFPIDVRVLAEKILKETDWKS